MDGRKESGREVKERTEKETSCQAPVKLYRITNLSNCLALNNTKLNGVSFLISLYLEDPVAKSEPG